MVAWWVECSTATRSGTHHLTRPPTLSTPSNPTGQQIVLQRDHRLHLRHPLQQRRALHPLEGLHDRQAVGPREGKRAGGDVQRARAAAAAGACRVGCWVGGAKEGALGCALLCFGYMHASAQASAALLLSPTAPLFSQQHKPRVPLHPPQTQMQLCDLYENDCIFDKFDCCMNGDASYIASGSYSNSFRVFGARNAADSTLEATRDPMRKRMQTPPAKVRISGRWVAWVGGRGAWSLEAAMWIWRCCIEPLCAPVLSALYPEPRRTAHHLPLTHPTRATASPCAPRRRRASASAAPATAPRVPLTTAASSCTWHGTRRQTSSHARRQTACTCTAHEQWRPS